MKPDRLTKVLLAVIALGIWANLMAPTRVQSNDAATIYGELTSISHDVRNIKRDISSISLGACVNQKLC